jgi:NADH:ubiquinone oxidoreductase subunit 4 (subunit M)
MVQRAFPGPNPHAWQLSNLTPREELMIASMIVGLLRLGLYPQPVFNTFGPALDNLRREAQIPIGALRR